MTVIKTFFRGDFLQLVYVTNWVPIIVTVTLVLAFADLMSLARNATDVKFITTASRLGKVVPPATAKRRQIANNVKTLTVNVNVSQGSQEELVIDAQQDTGTTLQKDVFVSNNKIVSYLKY